MSERSFAAVLVIVCLGCSSSGSGEGGGSGNAADGGSRSTAGSGGSGGTTGGSGGGVVAGGGGGVAGGGVASIIAPYATRIACNSTSNYVITSEGVEYTWNGTTTSTAFKVKQVSARDHDMCLIRDDNSSVLCSDSSSKVPTSIPSGAFSEVRVGSGIACAKDASGQLTCWGDGGAQTLVSDTPTTPVSHFDVGLQQACAVLKAGGAQCWGSSTHATPPANAQFSAIFTQTPFSCGISSSGMTCWTLSPAATPNVAAVAIGNSFACGIQTDGHAFCFKNSANDPSVPQPPSDSRFVEVAVGDSQACGIRSDGTVTCWGSAAGSLSQPPPDAIKVF